MAIDRADIARVSALGTFQGEAFVNVFHFRIDSDPAWSDTDLLALLAILDDAAADSDALAHFYTNMDAGLHIHTLDAVDLREVDPIGVQSSVNINGTSSGNDAPALLSVVAKWSTGFASRRRRGRTFLPGINVGLWDSSDPDKVDPTVAASINSDLGDFVTAWLANTDYSFVVFSQVAELETAGTGDAIITSASVNPVLGVQRRRRPAA